MRFYVLWTRRVTVQILNLNFYNFFLVEILLRQKVYWPFVFVAASAIFWKVSKKEPSARIVFLKKFNVSKISDAKDDQKKQTISFVYAWKVKRKRISKWDFSFHFDENNCFVIVCGFISDSSSLFETSKTTFLIPANPLYLRSFVILIFSFLTKL